MERRIEKRQLANILALFLIVQFGGLLFAFYTVPPSVIPQLLASSAASAPQNGEYLLFLAIIVVLGVAAAALVLITIMRTYKGNLLFKLLEAYAVGLPTFFLAFYFAGNFQYVTIWEGAIAGVIAAAALVLAKNRWPKLRNFATVIASIGIGVVIGFNGFALAYLFMVLIAAYDYIAVFITKHMQAMARPMVERNLAFLIGSSDMEMTPGSLLSSKEKKELDKQLRKTKVSDPQIKKMIKSGAYPSVSQVMLGGGDLALPLMLTVGAYISFASIFISTIIAIGSFFGLLATMWLLGKYKVPLPAIPPLFAFMNLGIAIALFAGGIITAYTALLFVIMFALIISIILMTLRRNQAKEKSLVADSGK